MEGQRLADYMVEQELNQVEMSNKVGTKRQNIWNWLQGGARVELTDTGIIIRLKSGRIVHHT